MMRKLIKVIAAHYGLSEQLNMAQEECAELIQAISKYRRKGNSNIPEEIADVEIMCKQLKYLMNCEDEIEQIKVRKVARQIERINAEIEEGAEE